MDMLIAAKEQIVAFILAIHYDTSILELGFKLAAQHSKEIDR
jgi:hypothetical protein